MKTKLRTQAWCDVANTLREFEAAHKVWMNTSVFTDAGRIARDNKNDAMARYDSAVAAYHKELGWK